MGTTATSAPVSAREVGGGIFLQCQRGCAAEGAGVADRDDDLGGVVGARREWQQLPDEGQPQE